MAKSVSHLAINISDSDARDSIWVFLSEQAALQGDWSLARNFADQISAESGEIDALSHILESWGNRNLKINKEQGEMAII